MADIQQSVIEKFVSWIKLKITLDSKKDAPRFKDREIWWANVGMNIGSEQNGKNKGFERPVLILRKFNMHMFLAVPLTSKEKDTPFHFRFDYKKYYYDIDNVLRSEDKSGVLILSQLRNMSNKRLIRKSGIVSTDDIKEIKDAVKSMI